MEISEVICGIWTDTSVNNFLGGRFKKGKPYNPETL